MNVDQLTPAPTNKLTAAMIGSAFIETTRTIVNIIWPDVIDGAFWIAMYPLAILAAGYFVKDAPNVDLSRDGA